MKERKKRGSLGIGGLKKVKQIERLNEFSNDYKEFNKVYAKVSRHVEQDDVERLRDEIEGRREATLSSH